MDWSLFFLPLNLIWLLWDFIWIECIQNSNPQVIWKFSLNKKTQIMTVKVKVAQLYPTLCDPMDSSLPSSSIHRILQIRILEWVAIPFSRDWILVSSLQADSLWTILSQVKNSNEVHLSLGEHFMNQAEDTSPWKCRVCPSSPKSEERKGKY